MDVLVSLPVVVPLLTAAVLAASSHFLARRADDIAGIAAAAATTGLSIALVVHSLDHDLDAQLWIARERATHIADERADDVARTIFAGQHFQRDT